MGYQEPSLAELRRIAAVLEQEYKGDNPQRLSFILLLKELTEKTQYCNPDEVKNILLGFIVFELEVIKSQLVSRWYNGSSIDAKLSEKLNINKDNLLTDSERFIYLHALYDYLAINCTPEILQALKTEKPNFVWKNKAMLVGQVISRLRDVRERDPQFYQVVHAVPGVTALQKNTAELCANYRKVAGARNNAERNQLLKFLEYVHHASDYLYKDVFKTITEMYKIEHDARRGLILFAMMHITNSSFTYRYGILSPQGGYFNSGSQLFNEGKEASNRSLNEISSAEKARLLKALMDRIVKIEKHSKDPDLIAYLRLNNIEPIKIDEAIIEEIGQYHTEQDRLKYEPRGASAAASSFASYATQTTAERAVRKGVGAYAVKGALGMAAMAVGGPIGFVSLSVLDYIGGMVGDGIISSMTASLYSWLLDKLGTSIGTAAVGALAGQYSISDEGINELRKQLSPEDEKQFCAWVNALLSVPLDVVKEVEKDNVRRVFGLEKGELLQPAEHLDYRLTNARALV